MFRLRHGPVAAAIDWFDIPGADEEPFVRSALRKRAMLAFALQGVVVLGAIRTAAEHNAVSTAVGAVAVRRHPTNRVAREKKQINAGVAHRFDAAELADVP